MLAAKTLPIDFPVGPGISQSLRCIQRSILEEFWGRGKQISHFRDFRSPPAPGDARETFLGALGGAAGGGVTTAAKTMPNDFSDDCATSESLCYAQGSISEQFGVRGKQIFDFRDFRSSPCS